MDLRKILALLILVGGIGDAAFQSQGVEVGGIGVAAVQARGVEVGGIGGQELMLDEIDSLMNRGNWERAEQRIVEYLRSRPGDASNALIFSNLGVCHLNMGRYEDALEDFDIALIKYPDSSKILTNKARTLLILGRNEESLETFDLAIEVNATEKDLYRMRGILLYEKGQFEDASKDFEKLRKLSGDELTMESPEMLAVIARTALARGNIEEATELYNLVTDSSQDSDLVFEGLCFSLTYLPDEITKDTVNKMVKKFPEEGRLYLVAAVLCERAYLHSESDMNKKIAKQYGIDTQTIEFFIRQNMKEQ